MYNKYVCKKRELSWGILKKKVCWLKESINIKKVFDKNQKYNVRLRNKWIKRLSRKLLKKKKKNKKENNKERNESK